MFGTKSKGSSAIDSLIGASLQIEGNIRFSGGLRIDGSVKGEIASIAEQPSMLVLSERAKVEGRIHVAHAVVNGEIDGHLVVDEHLELLSKARVTGDVYYKSLEIHPGATVTGRMVHHGDADQTRVLEFKTGSEPIARNASAPSAKS